MEVCGRLLLEEAHEYDIVSAENCVDRGVILPLRQLGGRHDPKAVVDILKMVYTAVLFVKNSDLEVSGVEVRKAESLAA